jgi:integrase
MSKLITAVSCNLTASRVASVKKGFTSVVGLADLSGKITPHTLRHMAAVWLMQRVAYRWNRCCLAAFLNITSRFSMVIVSLALIASLPVQL